MTHSSTDSRKLPEWASRLPSGTLVRYEQEGRRIVAITVSQSLDPTGEISAGGYWLSRSHDGGRSFAPPLYTGLRMFEPYVVLPHSGLPIIAGNHIQLEVKALKLDDQHIMLPPVALQFQERRDGIYLDISFADLARDSDRDGLTDIAEWAMLLNPHRSDTDGDGIPDGRDMLPQVPESHGTSRYATPLVVVLRELFGTSLGAIVTTSATTSGPLQPTRLGTGETDEYNDAGTSFMRAPAAYFEGIQLRQRVIVLNEAQAEALTHARGTFFPSSIATFVMSHDGTQALVVWSNGWTGGVLVFNKVDGSWKTETLSHWIT